MKKALFVLHQKNSEAGSIGKKLKARGFIFETVRPSLGDDLPKDLNKYNAIIVFGGGADKSYTHTQNSGATTWSVAHNLGKRPSVTVVDVNEIQGYGIVTHTDDNNLTVTFPGNTTGKAYCN